MTGALAYQWRRRNGVGNGALDRCWARDNNPVLPLLSGSGPLQFLGSAGGLALLSGALVYVVESRRAR